MQNRLRLAALLALPGLVAAAVAPSPRLPAPRKIVGSPSAGAEALIDGKQGAGWAYTSGSWVAMEFEAGHGLSLLTWNDVSQSWSDSFKVANACPKGTTFPVDYDISTSNNSTNGSDGTWSKQVSVANNRVASGTHSVSLSKATWIKFEVVRGGGILDEIQVFEQPEGNYDSWHFLGTSITQMAFKSFPLDSSFADMVHSRHPTNTPSMSRGGIPCINSTDVVKNLRNILYFTQQAKNIAIELGTNDGYNNGTANLATFKANLQTIVDTVLKRGKIPVIARVLSTDSSRAKWQIDPGYPLAVDEITTRNNLVPGPDFYSYFKAHPTELGADGIHPNAAGAQSIQRLWAEAMSKNLYGTNSTRLSPRSTSTRPSPTTRTVDVLGRTEERAGTGIRFDTSNKAIGIDLPSK